MGELNGFRISILAPSGHEEWAVIQAVRALRAAGASVIVLSTDAVHLPTGRTDALMLAGDVSAALPMVRGWISEFDQAGKPIAAIGQAVGILVEAGFARGRLVAAQSRALVVDGNWLTARGSEEAAVFAREMIALCRRAATVIQVAESA